MVVWNECYLAAVADAGGGRVHVKFDSGMGRLGTRDPAEATSVALAARATPGIELVGAMTHFATADELSDDGFFAEQLAAFAAWAHALKDEQPELIVHAANSAAMLREVDAQFDMVRCGIAIYGMDPFGRDPAARATRAGARAELLRGGRQAMQGGGERRLRPALRRPSTTPASAVLPVGYGDGWRRACPTTPTC